MSDNFLITGYWGKAHVTAENDRGINAAIFGKGRFVLPVGEQFRAEYIGNNTIRMYDGKMLDNGAAAGIPAGQYVDLLIANAGQGMKRNDLIVFEYQQDSSTLIESGKFVVIQGEETSGTASDPILTQQDLLSNEATFDQFALWRVQVAGTAIAAPIKLFNISSNIKELNPVIFEIASNGDSVTFKNGKTVVELFECLENNMPVKVKYYMTSESYIVLNGIKKSVLPIGSGTAYQLYSTQELSTVFATVTNSTISVSILDTAIDDYVLESGKTGNWNYRKWLNGVIEAWGKVDITLDANDAYEWATGTGIYCASGWGNLPSNIFTSVETIVVSPSGGSDIYSYLSASARVSAGLNIAGNIFGKGTGVSSLKKGDTFALNCIVKGKWK